MTAPEDKWLLLATRQKAVHYSISRSSTTRINFFFFHRESQI